MIVKGNDQPILQEEGWPYDPNNGWVHWQRYRGVSRAAMAALQQQLVAQGIACELTNVQGGTASLTLNDTSYQNPVDTWEVVANDEARDLFEHPIITAFLTSTEIATMRRYLAENLDANSCFTDSGCSSLAGSDLALAIQFYILYQRGTTEYRRAQYVLRHRMSVPNRWGSNVSDIGVEEIYTTAQLLTETEDVTAWTYPLPARLAYKISNIPAPTTQTNYMWGWLKSPSTETTAANNRIDILTEYTLEQWSVQPNGIYKAH